MTGQAYVERSGESEFGRFSRKVFRHLRARFYSHPRPTILMYHRIAEAAFDPWGTIVSPAMFASHLAWIAEHRTPLPLTKFANLHVSGQLPANAIAVTFDDGYADNAELAAPLLEKFGVPATIFLPVEWIERGEPFWWDELADIVFEHEGPTLRLGKREFRLFEKRADDGQWKHSAPPLTPRQLAFSRIWQDLIAQKPGVLERSLEELRRQFKGSPKRGSPPTVISQAQIRHLSSAGVEFGSHTLTHPDLTRVTAAQRRREILGSVSRCEALTGLKPVSFAYPFGIFDADCEQLVEAAGFECACSTETAAVNADSRTHALPRVQVGNWTGRRLALRLALV